LWAAQASGVASPRWRTRGPGSIALLRGVGRDCFYLKTGVEASQQSPTGGDAELVEDTAPVVDDGVGGNAQFPSQCGDIYAAEES
jgi:hypothetical protein